MQLFSITDLKLVKLGLFTLENRRLQGDPGVPVPKQDTGKLGRDSDRECSDRARNNGFKLKEGRSG